MPDESSGLVRLGRLMEMAGVALCFVLVPCKLPPYLYNNFPKLSSIWVMFALFNNSFMRSFASSIRMMGSSLAIIYNGT